MQLFVIFIAWEFWKFIIIVVQIQVVSFLEEVGFDKESIGRIIARCPEISATSVEKTLKRKLEFLIKIGVSKTHLPRAIKKYPELLVSDPHKTLHPR